MSTAGEQSAQCCIVGGGPAGMMAALLFARAGVRTILLEKHADFLRDFRGDTIHPSTMEIMSELGLLEAFLERPHQEVTSLAGNLGDTVVQVADFTHLPSRCKFLAFMPQWDFLNFLAEEAKRYPTFELRTQARAGDLLWEGERVVGVRAQTPTGSLEIRATLTVAADGRSSLIRERAGLRPIDLGAPMDVLWLRLSKFRDDPHETFGYIRNGRIMALIDRGAYWQCAYVISKGTFQELRARGLDAFRQDVSSLVPFLSDRVEEIDAWDDVKLLTVQVNRLTQWYLPGLLCIGDAAHAMSPIGGVGINLAIQDAVAAANLLAGKLARGTTSAADLRAVQRRRERAARLTQTLQLFIQRNVIGRVLGGDHAPPVLAGLRGLVRRLPILTRIPARLIGLGFRPEHVEATRS
ncbi:MAG: FAD-dependent oxidoreductase [Candidatus Eremiobacteraeota bacterium]|nr:FAD-dependent oxidoreductase [Candidatus Eremiobacteraeota bacterium]MBV9699607.1 FAD-dependent oxidoreductase [Candidatus Eremiobacteraeota bacterium]